MKKLVAPGQVVIPSNFPRTRQGPDSRGFRICFAELGRSCALKQGFLIFTDGSAYSYDAVSNDVTEALCDQLRRGFTFNRFFRRAGFGFIRGFVPPADYETIYAYPPYAGTAPTACPVPLGTWPNLLWTTSFTSDQTSTGILWTPSGGTASAIELDFDDSIDFTNWSASGDGMATYNGPAVSAAVALLSVGAQPSASTAFSCFVLQDGNVIGFFPHSADVNFSDPGSVMFADTMGADSVIEVQLTWGGSFTPPGTNFVFTATAS
jgi:hypothetical protein